MLTIDELRMCLPSPLRERAESIARLLGKELGRLGFDASAHISNLSVPAIHVPGDARDVDVARAVAQAIRAALRTTPAEGG